MPTSDRYTFPFDELVEMLAKKAGVTEGRWVLSVEFGIGAVNLSAEPDSGVFRPAAVVPIVGIGIQRVDESVPATNLIFDASLAKSAVDRKPIRKTSKQS
jgi:hypothetical protein